MNHNEAGDSQGYGQTKAFKYLTKEDILQFPISIQFFRSWNDGTDVGFFFYVFDIRYKEDFPTAQSLVEKFNFDGVFSADLIGFALVLTNNL